MKMSLKRLLLVLLPTLLIAPNNIYAMQSNRGNNDPLQALDYQKAFDQTAIYHRYGELMTEEGIDENVFPKEDGAPASSRTCPSTCVSIAMLCKKGYHLLKTEEQSTQRQKFEHACLAKLDNARHSAILSGAKSAGIMMGLTISTTYGLNKWLVDEKTMGGSFAVFNACIGAIYYIRDIVESISGLKQPHRHIDDLEKKYAINKRFIPNKLWEKIEKNFEYARRDHDHQAQYIDFLEFALNFTTLKPQQSIAINTDDVINTLFARIDNFLKAYNVTPWQTALLKINIRNFIENVTAHKHHAIRYVYLFGAGGIGKSEFVEQLHQWLEELMPNIVHFNKKAIETPIELEGDAQHKGILLKTLGEQLAQEKYGSIILLDDAEWLKKDGSMASAAKRVFNGNLAEIQTTYFSQCDSDNDFKLPIPPMLIFVTSNDEIKDEALASRFDIIHFPSNGKDALKECALELCQIDREYQQANDQAKAAIKDQFMREIECGTTMQNAPMRSFRDVKLHVAPLCFYMTHPHEQPYESCE